MSERDEQVFTDMLRRAGVNFTLREEPGEHVVDIRAEDLANTGTKNEGYCSFFALFHFNEDGKLLKVGIWE